MTEGSPSTDKMAEALALLERFEVEGASQPKDAEKLIANIFRACGLSVTETGFVGGDEGVDCFFRTNLDGKPQVIGVEVRANKKPVPTDVVERALDLKSTGRFDRVMVVASGGFTRAAVYHAEAVALGQVDLLVPNDLRNWIAKAHTPPSDPALTQYQRIVHKAMQDLASEIAKDPQRLWDAEWRDLERILHVTFEGLGFQCVLTRGSQDGGFDLELTIDRDGKKEVYLIEVKHWMDQKPGKSQLTKLIRVTAEQKAAGGLLLSTSGFTKTIASGIVEYEQPIHLGDSKKMVSLIQTYHRMKSALWMPLPDPHSTLFSGTKKLEASQRT